MLKIHFILVFLVVSCSTVRQPIVINTSPPAKITIYDRKGAQIMTGDAPQAIPINQFKDPSQFIRVVASLPGYIPENILLPLTLASSTSGEITIELKKVEDWVDLQSSSSSKVANDISKQSIAIFKLIKNSELEKALEITQSLKIKFPFAPIFYEIEGAIHTLRGKLELASDSYSTSLKLDPSNQDVKEVSTYIEKQLGKRAP